MMINRAVVLQALKAMEANRYAVADQAPHGDVMAYNAATEALRAAVLAQEQAKPAQEPVPQPGVWMHPWPPVRAQEPTPPPEAVTEAEKTAYAAGWWAAMAKGGGNSPPPLAVPPEVAATITTTDIAWLLTHRLTKIWQELGQMRWAGADEGWDRAIEAVRRRLDAECQDVLDWKAQADQSGATAAELLQKVQGLRA